MKRLAGAGVVGALVVGSFQAAMAEAQEPTNAASATAVWAGVEAPPVDTLVALALVRAPEIAAQRSRAAASGEIVTAAGALDDPMLGVAYRDVGFPEYTVGEAEMSMIEAEIQQPLPFPGKRGARRNAASAAAVRSAADLHTIRRRVESEVRVLYARLYAIDRAGAILRSTRALLRLLESTAASRYASGTAELEPQIRAQLAASRLEERLEDLQAERRSVQAAINRYLDRPADAALGVVETLPEVSPPPADWRERAVTWAPEVLAARAAVTAAEMRLEAERSEKSPDLFVGAGYGYRGGLDPIVTLRVGMELPLWRSGRQGSRIRAAEYELETARSERREAEARARSTAETLIAAWERSSAQVRRYREAIRPQSRTALEAARASYEAGKGDFSTVIEDFERWLQAEEQLAAREAERFAAHAELGALLVAPPQAEGAVEEESQ